MAPTSRDSGRCRLFGRPGDDPVRRGRSGRRDATMRVPAWPGIAGADSRLRLYLGSGKDAGSLGAGRGRRGPGGGPVGALGVAARQGRKMAEGGTWIRVTPPPGRSPRRARGFSGRRWVRYDGRGAILTWVGAAGGRVGSGCGRLKWSLRRT